MTPVHAGPRAKSDSRIQRRARLLMREMVLPAPVAEVFAFFSDAGNLDRITPPMLRFRTLTPMPIEMGEGTIIDYALRLRGVPFRWRTRIALWQPPHRFADEQTRGPYRLWHHTHEFEPVAGGTLCRDVVLYRHWGGPIGEHLLVRPDLERIFDYRSAQLLAVFSHRTLEANRPSAHGPPHMRR